MAINKEDMKIEQQCFKETLDWISMEVKNINEEDNVLKEKIAGLRKQSKGKYSEELETSEKLYDITHKNLKKYSEAYVQPYFGRIDFREYKRDVETFYVGKFGLGDLENGDEKVIDWRAPIADLYYSGTEGDAYYVAPMGIISGELKLKRKFLIKNSKLLDAFDEGINEIMIKGSNENGSALMDEYLKINLEESVSSKLKDVVATIQKEQNEIIRADKNKPLIVQGSAGSGKTTVALHRLAYLLYKHKDKINGEDILVIAPNKLFLDYISEVLPDLGVDNVRQKTYEEIACEFLQLKGKVYNKDKKLSEILESSISKDEKLVIDSSKLKGSNEFKSIIDKYIKYLEVADSEIEDIKVDNYVLFEKEEIKRLFINDMSKLPLNKRKEEIKRYFSLKLNDKINSILEKIDFTYEYSIARTKKTMEDSIERRKRLTEIYDERDVKKADIKVRAKKEFDNYFVQWKGIDTRELYMDLFNNSEVLEEVIGDTISKELILFIKKYLNENYENNVIDSDDLPIMLYLKIMIEGISDKYRFKHIVIDEAQDYSIFQLIAIQNMAVNNSFTIVGDVGQGIYYYKGIDSWESVIEEVFQEEVPYVQLTQSYRSTIEIIEFANNVLKKQHNNLKPAVPVLRHGKKPEIISFNTGKEFSERLDLIVAEVESMGKKNVAVIGKTYEECKKIKEHLKKHSNYKWEIIKDTDKSLKLEKIIIPSYMTKGLEFDCSVIYNCNNDIYSDRELDKKILYVALTRALHLEYVFYNGEKSNLIQ